MHFLTLKKSITIILLLLLLGVGIYWTAGNVAPSAQDLPVKQALAQVQENNNSDEEHDGESNRNEGHSLEVHLSSDQQRSIGIQTEVITDSSVSSGITRPASVVFNPDLIARIGPRVNAKVTRVYADLGDWVEQGEVVAVMSSMELGQVKSDYLTAKAHLETARTAYEREQSLFEKEISSEAELLEARARFQEARAEVEAAATTLRLYGLSQKRINNLSSGNSGQLASQFVLRSPISGRVQERNISPGQSVSSSEMPIHIANSSEMWAMIDAYERDLSVLKEGQDIVLTVRGFPGQRFRGQIDFISSQLDEETRTVRARAVIDNDGGILRSGMFGKAKIQTGGGGPAYPMISVDAVQTVEGQSVVFVPGNEEGAFRAVPVKTGAETESGLVAITFGLQSGDQAVIEGAFDLKSVLTSKSRSASHGH